MIKTKQIFHHWELWEDYRYNFYDNCSGEEKVKKSQSVFDMFNSEQETRRCMFFVVDNWRYSMEQNLTNPSINKVAYIGQCACAYFDNIPNTVTMENWSHLDKAVRDRSDKIALEAIERWKSNNKFIQLCLSLD